MAECQTPFTVKTTNKVNGELQSIAVPCGKCPACFARRVSQWSFRLMEEEKVSTSAHFITLTYNTETVSITDNGFMTLNKEHIQKFFKRLRKLHNKDIRIKYYLCGEYGGITKRPHYHAIIYNCDINLIDKAWGLGSTHFGNVSEASVGYTLKYMSKKGIIPMHKNDDRLPEFALMSKNWAHVI